MKYQVFEGNEEGKEIPCNSVGVSTLKSEAWTTNEFDTFEKAKAYANQWCGVLQPSENYYWKINEKYEFGFGGYVVIKEVGE